MEPADVDRLTPVAQDYLKAIWSAVEWQDPPVTTTALADRFGTSRAAVSDTMRRLASQELVVYQPYHPVTLTPVGERLAIAMVRRHRLIETFLAEVVGYQWDEVHDDAERLEHAASPLFLDRIDTLLGHPATDPHGDPIPAADGQHRQQPSIPLSGATPGRYRVLRVADTDPTRLSRLRSLGISLGTLLSVTSPPTHYLAEDTGAVPMTDDDVDAIRVIPASPSPASR